MRLFTIQHRVQVLINTDPQRRCYNGCYFSAEWQWTGWVDLVLNVTEETLEDKLKFWRDLNDYAVSQRGAGAKKEFRAVPEALGQPVDCDFSSLELRILANLEASQAAKPPKDQHRITAAEIFSVSEENVTDEQRRYAKIINAGLIYGPTGRPK